MRLLFLLDVFTNSFSGETLVMTARGLRPISELIEGDLVLAWDQATGKTGYFVVTDTISHVDPEIVLLTLDGETLETTAEHPFYVVETSEWLPLSWGGRWVDAGELQVGDDVLQADGSTGEVQSVRVVAQRQPMYNLTVDQAHTFFVGHGQWLVHNARKCGVSLQSMGGAVGDAVEKGFHINITDITGAELGLKPGANNTILLTSLGRTKVNAGDYIKDVSTLLTNDSEKVLAQLRGIISTYGANHQRGREAQQLIDMITNGVYTVATQ